MHSGQNNNQITIKILPNLSYIFPLSNETNCAPGRKYVSFCVLVENVSVENVSVENVSVEKTSRCRFYDKLLCRIANSNSVTGQINQVYWTSAVKVLLVINSSLSNLVQRSLCLASTGNETYRCSIQFVVVAFCYFLVEKRRNHSLLGKIFGKHGEKTMPDRWCLLITNLVDPQRQNQANGQNTPFQQ